MSVEGTELDRRVARGAGGMLAVKTVNLGASFLVQVALARFLGPQGFGQFALALAWLGVLALPALLGFDKVVTREFARDRVSENWSRIRGLLTSSTRAVSVLGVTTACASLLVIRATVEPTTRVLFCLTLAMVPLIALIRLWAGAMRGLGRVASSEVPELALHPALFLLAILLIWGAWPSAGPAVAIVARSATLLIATVVAAIMLRRALPQSVRETTPARDLPLWWKGALSMALISAMYVLNNHLDVLFLGSLRGPEEVALYSAGNRVARFVLLALLVVNRASAPEFAQLWRRGDREGLQRLVTRSSRVVLWFSVPVALGLILAAGPLLALFGPGFQDARGPLVVLALAQLINAITGSVGLLLLMTGRETTAALYVGAGAAVNAMLNLLLIPKYGALGAAWATGTAIILVNIFQLAAVVRHLGIWPTAFTRLRRPE